MKTNRCVTVEEGWPVCSIGNHLSACIMTARLRLPRRAGDELHGKDVPMPYAANLEKLALPNATDEVVEAAKAVLP
jgi:pyruvate dehydrogenase E1 component beta subunit